MDWKLPVGSAGFAFCISLFSGIVGGVSFGTMVLRATVSALVFGALGAGIALVARRYLPELFESFQPEDAGPEVDITLDEENPHSEPEERVLKTRSGEEDRDASFEDAEAGEESMRDASDGDLDGGDYDSADAGLDSFDPGEDPGLDTAEDLPSFDGVESAFTAPQDGDDDDNGASSGSTIDVLGTEEDPAVIARAVRTLMNREKEG